MAEIRLRAETEPSQPSSSRVLIWRHLKQVGTVSAKWTGWLLPRNEIFEAKVGDLRRNVEEMGGKRLPPFRKRGNTNTRD